MQILGQKSRLSRSDVIVVSYEAAQYTVVTAPPLAWISIEIAYERQDIALSAHSSIDPHQSGCCCRKASIHGKFLL